MSEQGPSSDPLIDEIRSIRASISAEFLHDVRAHCEALRKLQEEYADPYFDAQPALPRGTNSGAVGECLRNFERNGHSGRQMKRA